MANHLRPSGDEAVVVAGVIGVMVRDDDDLHGLRRHRTNLFHQAIVVGFARELGVHEDDALVGHAHDRVGSAARHHVETGLQHLDRLNGLAAAAPATATLRRLLLCVADEDGCKHCDDREEESRHEICLRSVV